VKHVKARSLATAETVHEVHGSTKAGELKWPEAISSQPVTQELRTTALRSVFAGREAIGHVVAWPGRGFEAYLPDDTSLGFHETPEAAVAAISAAVDGQGGR